MRDKTKILHRPWLYLAYPWRAADKNGKFCYFGIKPRKSAAGWVARSFKYIRASSEAGQNYRDWAEEFWSISLQSYEQYKTAYNQQWPNQDQKDA